VLLLAIAALIAFVAKLLLAFLLGLVIVLLLWAPLVFGLVWLDRRTMKGNRR
jgi:hypothetical protein